MRRWKSRGEVFLPIRDKIHPAISKFLGIANAVSELKKVFGGGANPNLAKLKEGRKVEFSHGLLIGEIGELVDSIKVGATAQKCVFDACFNSIANREKGRSSDGVASASSETGRIHFWPRRYLPVIHAGRESTNRRDSKRKYADPDFGVTTAKP